MARRGALIVLEGCDRSGKTTQCKMLVDALNKQNIPAKFMFFPDRTTPTGMIINDYLCKKISLPDQAVHLLFSANRWEQEPKMRKLLESGTTLIVDRYSFSGVAFSAAKEIMNFNWCWQPELGLPKPDAVFLLNLSQQAIIRRGGFGNERYEESDFQKRVWSNFDLMKDKSWRVIDADKKIEELHRDILSLFNAVYNDCVDAPLRVFSKLNLPPDAI